MLCSNNLDVKCFLINESVSLNNGENNVLHFLAVNWLQVVAFYSFFDNFLFTKDTGHFRYQLYYTPCPKKN